MRSRVMTTLLGGILLAAAATLSACAESEDVPPRQAQEGNPDQGAVLIEQYGCGTCHSIPGIQGADGLVGPPLDHFARRTYIAGVLHNSEDNLQHWVMDPQEVVPGNAMPDMGVTKQQAADIVAYLYTLK